MMQQNTERVYKIYKQTNDNADFGIYDYNAETDGLNEYHESAVDDYIGIRSGYVLGSYEKIAIYCYVDIAATNANAQVTPAMDPAINLFRMFVEYINLAIIPEYAVDFISNIDASDIYEFIKDNISEITEQLRYCVDLHIIMYEYANTYRKNRYTERVSMCLTSSGTIIMRWYCRNYSCASRVADTYLSDFNIDIPSSSQSDPDKNVIFIVTQVEFSQDGTPIHAKKYQIYDTNMYVTVPLIELSAESIQALKRKYIEPIFTEIIDAMEHADDLIIANMIANN